MAKKGSTRELRDEFVQVRLSASEREKAERLMWELEERGVSCVLRRLLQDACTPRRRKRRVS